MAAGAISQCNLEFRAGRARPDPEREDRSIIYICVVQLYTILFSGIKRKFSDFSVRSIILNESAERVISEGRSGVIERITRECVGIVAIAVIQAVRPGNSVCLD